MVYCTECGAKNPDENRFCTECGTELPKVKVPARAKPEEKPEKAVARKEPEKPAEKIIVKKKGGKGKWVAAIIILAVLGFLGYRYFTEKAAFDALDADITGAGTPSVGLTSASIPLTLTFNNPSGNESPPVTLSYTAYISGVSVATASSSVGSIPANSSKTSQLTITVSYTQVGTAIWRAISTGNFTVTLTGKLEGKLVFGLISVSKSFSTSYSF